MRRSSRPSAADSKESATLVPSSPERGIAARRLLHGDPGLLPRRRRGRRDGGGALGVEPQDDALRRDLVDVQLQRGAGLDPVRQLRGERDAGQHDHAVLLPARGDARHHRRPRAQGEVGHLRLQQQRLDRDDGIDHRVKDDAPRPNTHSMERGLYIAASGMLAEQIRQDQIANDLANASTPGYKADRTSQSGFGDLLLANSATGATVGSQGTAVQVSKIETDFSPKPARETGEPLDFAIVGEGFFAVQTDRGTRYTRNGQFTADAQGRLVTAQGDPVLGRNGQPAVGRPRRPRGPAQPPDRQPRATRARTATRSSPARPPATAAARSAPAPSRAPAPTRRARWST